MENAARPQPVIDVYGYCLGCYGHFNLPAATSSGDDQTPLPFGNVVVVWLYTGISKSALHEWQDSCICAICLIVESTDTQLRDSIPLLPIFCIASLREKGRMTEIIG